MKKSISCKITLVVCALLVVTAVYYTVNAVAVSNFSAVVVVCAALAAVCCAAFALVPVKWADLGNLVAVPLSAAALTQLLIGSINTIADVTSGITMFGSQGGLEWIITTAVMLVVSLLAEIASCFLSGWQEFKTNTR